MQHQVPAIPITLRDYLASQAMAGLVVNSRPNHPFITEKEWFNNVASRSYAIADAMLAVRSVPKEGGAQ